MAAQATGITQQDVPKAPLQYLAFVSQHARVLMLLAFILGVSGGVCSNALHYTVKQFVNAVGSPSAAVGSPSVAVGSPSATVPAWIWGLAFFGQFLCGALLNRASAFVGLVPTAALKRNSYKLLLRFLSESRYNDEPGAVVQRIALVSENVPALFEAALGQGTSIALALGAALLLAASVHPVLCGALALWGALHCVSACFLTQWKRKFTVLHAETTSRFQGQLVEFCRTTIYTPGKLITALSQEIDRLYDLAAWREQTQKLDARIGEGLKTVYNLIHGLFVLLVLIAVIVLWQERAISSGDVAMVLSVVRSVQQALDQTTALMIQFGQAYAEAQAGLRYMHAESRKALLAPKEAWAW